MARRRAVSLIAGLHRVGDRVGVHDDPSVHVARGAARGLDERAARPQEAFLVGVEHRDQRDLGQVETFAQQVDADQHVELAAPEIAQDLDPLERVDVGVQVADPHAELVVVLGQVLGHPLGERRHQHALLARDAAADLAEQVVDLALHRAHLDRRIHQPGRPDHLLDDHAARLLAARRPRASPRRRRPAAPASSHSSKLSGRLSSAEGRRKPYSTSTSLRERSPKIHPAHLRHRLVALVDDQQGVGRQVVEQRRRRLARRAAGEVPRVVLDAVAVADLLDHLEVEHRPLVQALRLEHPPLVLEESAALGQLELDRLGGVLQPVAGGDEVRLRVDRRSDRADAASCPVIGSKVASSSTSSPNSPMRTAISS